MKGQEKGGIPFPIIIVIISSLNTNGNQRLPQHQSKLQQEKKKTSGES
jgi:hypothetical protein